MNGDDIMVEMKGKLAKIPWLVRILSYSNLA